MAGEIFRRAGRFEGLWLTGTESYDRVGWRSRALLHMLLAVACSRDVLLGLLGYETESRYGMEEEDSSLSFTRNMDLNGLVR